jgi:hypothetical protein
MGLLPEDRIPNAMTPRQALAKIYRLLDANMEMIRRYVEDVAPSVQVMEHADKMTDLEVRALLGEVIYGRLEYFYHVSDGQYKMAAYVEAAMKSDDELLSFTDEERVELKGSKLGALLYRE